MKFTIEQPDLSIAELCQKIDYEPQLNETSFNYVKPVGEEEYPRFHLLIEKEDSELTFKLHLDRKTFSEGLHHHRTEHESEVVRKELNRIKEEIFAVWGKEQGG